jgi:zinc transport system substrate-binding protein
MAVLAVLSFGEARYRDINRTGVGDPAKIKTVASFYPLYYFAKEIGDDKADVSDITPSGAEPHDYEPSPQEIAEIESSRLLILNGAGLESWGDSVRQNLSSDTITIVASEGLDLQSISEGGKNIEDPHVWLSPIMSEKIAEKITEGFIEADSDNEQYYRRNENALIARLQKLDSDYKSALDDCALHSIVTSHAAFGYLASVYDFTQIPIAGISPDSEPSPKQLAGLSDYIRANHLKYIFFENSSSAKLSETLASEAGAETLVLSPLESLNTDDIARGNDYFTVMEANLSNLKIALECR